MATSTTGNYKVSFVFDNKAYTTSVFRQHGVASFPRYVMQFKSGVRHLTRWGNASDKLIVSIGDPLPQGLLDAIYEAIKEQVESSIDLREPYENGYAVNEEFLKET